MRMTGRQSSRRSNQLGWRMMKLARLRLALSKGYAWKGRRLLEMWQGFVEVGVVETLR